MLSCCITASISEKYRGFNHEGILQEPGEEVAKAGKHLEIPDLRRKNMKNFSMPKQVSQTLEIDELMRLKHSLEKNVSREVAESIIKEIPLSINSTPDIRAEWVENLSAILENRFDKKTLNENGAGWFIKGNQLYTKMFSCECPMLEKAKNSNSLTWCHCTAGYNKKLFEIVFEKPVYVEIVQSIRQGFDFCLLRITFQ